MLRTLSISNYVLIDSLEIDFPEGLIIITGQTGAGKSIILGALSLLMGAKSDASVISGGADSCVVEAAFDVESEELKALFDANELEWDGGHIVVRRVVHRSGRSRSFVNDSPVQVQLLSGIAASLVDIHSQHQSLLLTDHRFQLSVLDMYARNDGLLAACKSSYEKLQAMRAELSDIEIRLHSLEAEREYNESRFARLEAARLKEGELEELEGEQTALANAEEIKESFEAAGEWLSPSREEEGRTGVSAALREAQRLLQKAGRFVPAAAALAERIGTARIDIDDIVSEVSALGGGIELSQERLQAVDDRLALLYDLMHKYDCQSVSSLIEIRDSLSQTLYDSTALQEAASSLREEISSEANVLDGICRDLHERRAMAAETFAEEVLAQLRFLELDRALFKVALSPAPVGVMGADSAVFMFSSTGTAPVDVAKCASGGELSRIMLSLKAMMAHFTSMPTMIFDEIDTGVSGSVADRMGSLICSMGTEMQVFAITHLPQVAAKGRAHYLVSKATTPDGRVISSIRLLDGEERVREIARLLSGATVTPEALANAKSLLDS